MNALTTKIACLWKLSKGGILVLISTFLMVSCIDDNNEDETVLYDDTAITAFSLTGARLFHHTTSSTGGDSVYYTSAGSAVTSIAFHIDQVNRRIFNTDSLPLNTDLSKMLCSVSTRNNGLPFIKPLEPGDYVYVSTTDSIDFTESREVRVYSSDGKSYVTYMIDVSKHNEDGGAFNYESWKVCDAFKQAAAIRLVALGDAVLAFVRTATATEVYQSPAISTYDWTKFTASLSVSAAENVTVSNDSLFVLDGTTLLLSLNGKDYQTVSATGQPSALLGSSSRELYGMSADGQLMVSADKGKTWGTDHVAYEDAADKERVERLLPKRDIAIVTLPQGYSAKTDYVVMVGNRDVTAEAFANDSVARTWRKIVDYSNGTPEGQWVCTNEYEEVVWPLPAREHLQLFTYDGRVLAFGGKGIGHSAAEAYDTFYESRDGGITWKPSTLVPVFGEQRSEQTMRAVTVDSHSYIWMVCGGTGEVFKGRLTRLGWK